MLPKPCVPLRRQHFLELLNGLVRLLIFKVHTGQAKPDGARGFGTGGIAEGGFGTFQKTVGVLDKGKPFEHGITMPLVESVRDLVFAVHRPGKINAAHVFFDQTFDAVKLPAVKLSLTVGARGIGKRVRLHSLVGREEFGIEVTTCGLAVAAIAFKVKPFLEEFKRGGIERNQRL